ncbi:S8 family serine peptidase [Nocardioides sp. CN2-186]|uniref:S8 family serine peptidase n=1 Tax=Nocardioides tweenelious TaxID=3156607 RepID=UPI0032B5E906
MPSSRTRLVALTCALSAALSLTGLAVPAADAGPALDVAHPGLDRLLADGTPDGRAIVTFAAPPTRTEVARLTALGLVVRPMTHLPLALVDGPVAAMTAAVGDGIGLDVYPDEQLDYLDTSSSNAMSSTPAAGKALRKQGLTGTGVTVAVVDSGCDATHADLADRVTHNVTLVSPEYANAGTRPALVVPVDQGPLSNTDLGSGHGTHVAGIIAADSRSVSDGSRFGVAPGADIVCLSIGLALFTSAVVTAYDYMLDQPDLLGIDVVNNSWGNSYRQFDPHDPVAVATKAVADRGVTVVFAAGNSGAGNVPMSLNPFSQAPWVISVAAGTTDRFRGDFSSNGLVHDNSLPTDVGADDHTIFTGDRIGLVHPDITAPGVDISSTCDSAGTLIGPCGPDQNASASGTSMASPHVAGAAAVLLQAQPALTPEQVRLALQATATPVKAPGGRKRLPFWEVGFGYTNLDRAVRLVQSKGWATKLSAAAARADRRVLAADGATVLRSDFFVHPAPPVAAIGTDSTTYDVPVGQRTRTLAVSLAFPSGGTVGASLFSYTVDVIDPSGTVVATSTNDPVAGSGTALATVALPKGAPAGTYSFHVTGDYAVSDPDTIDSDSVLGRFVTLHVAQLARG